MKEKISTLRNKFKEHPELWFFVFANFVFVVMFVWSLLITPSLLKLPTLILFTTLTLFHIGIHWTLLIVAEDERWFWPYVIIQGLLAFAIILMSQNIGMIFALYMALIGEMIGSIRRRSWSVIAVIFFLVLSFSTQIILEGAQSSLWWLLGTAMSMLFVVLYVSLYTQETTARYQAQKLLTELEVANRQLSDYAAQVEALTLKDERQRMARELHDTLAQGLAGLILQLEAADSHISADHHQKAQTIIQQAMARARTTLADARQAIGDLRSTQSPTDLAEAIRQEVDRFTRDTRIACKLDLTVPEKLSSENAENAVRAVSEGLINIARHADATKASVEMTYDDDLLEIEIQDNGIGFDPEECVGRAGHYGLLGMRERARISGGSLVIESVSSQGSTLRLELPLSNEND
ncbi:MAG: sensor histidine kinase [Anaerolineales bacterium]|nr:sensor histidine kinase [Chloroflexota bacterium]MBL6980642.1 sensor histidine kinase [Anaerolineales bacterium]